MTIKTAIILLLIFFGLLLFAENSQAVSYYVKNDGNDNAAGTSDATAWARVPGMVGWAGSKTLQSGDIVYFRSQDTWSTSSGDELLTTITAGVTYVGNGWGTGTRAKFMASGALGEAIVTIYASNVTFRGFEVDGNTQNSGGIYVNPADSNIHL